MKELELTEEERSKLEALYLKAELVNRDIQKGFSLLNQLQQETQQFITAIAKQKGLNIKSFRPEFQDYRLLRIIIEEELSS